MVHHPRSSRDARCCAHGPGSAYHIRLHECTDLGAGAQSCIEGTTVGNAAITPSGNQSVTYHARYDASLTQPPFCSVRTQSNENLHYLLRPDETQQYHFTNRGQTTFTCPDGTTTTCVFTFNFTIANGEVVADKSSYECTGPAPALAASAR